MSARAAQARFWSSSHRPRMATTLVSMGRRPPPPQHDDDGLLPRSSVARGLLDDKSEEARVALCALTLYDDAKTLTTNATTAPRALSLSIEDSDDDPGYERDHDLTPKLPKWKRRRRQRIHTLLKPYAKKKHFGASSGSGSARALASLSSSREKYPGLANADVSGVGKEEPEAAPDERRQRMAQATRRLAHLRAESALRHWREGADSDHSPEPDERPDAPTLVPAFDRLSLATAGAGGAVAAAASSCASARALCERVRQQARRKLREERKRVLLARQAAREEARKHAAATTAAASTPASLSLSTALIPVTEPMGSRRLAFAERAAAFRRQQRLQAALEAWQQLTAAAAAKLELEQKLLFRLKAAGILLVRAQLRGALRAWCTGVAAAAKQQATDRGLGLLVAAEQRRALRIWRCAATADESDKKQVKGAPSSSSSSTSSLQAVTGGGDLGSKGSGTKGIGMVWFLAACDWFKDELVRVVSPPRRKADADEYLDCM